MATAPGAAPSAGTRLAVQLGIPFAISFLAIAVIGAVWPAQKYSVRMQAVSRGVDEAQLAGTAVEVVRHDGLRVAAGALDQSGAYTVSLAAGTYAFCVADTTFGVQGGSDPPAVVSPSGPFPSGGNSAVRGAGGPTAPSSTAVTVPPHPTSTVPPTKSGGGGIIGRIIGGVSGTTPTSAAPATTTPPSGPSAANPYSCIDAAIASSRVVQIPVLPAGGR